MDANIVATSASVLIAGGSLAYTLSARPKVRAFCHRLYEEDEAGNREYGLVVFIVNTGRAPAVILGAGAWNGQKRLMHVPEPPSDLSGHGASATFPLVLAPGGIAHVWIANSAMGGTQFGAVQARYPWYGWRWLRHPRLAPKTIWLRQKKIHATLKAL